MMTAVPPRAWTTVALGEVAAIERDGVAPDQIESGTTYVGLENIQSGGEFVGVGKVENGDLASTKFAFSPHHVLYGKLRPYLAKIACPDFSGVCSTDILPILPGKKLDRRYLCYYLRQPTMVEYANSRCSGANLPRLSPRTLSEFEIPLPPLSEQRRIADVLDKADAIRRKRREARNSTFDLLVSSYLHLFGHPSSNRRKWPTSALGNICQVERGKFTPRPRNDPKFYGGDYPFIQTGDISCSGGLLSNWRQTLNELGISVSRSFNSGTVVIAIVGATIGETAILTRKMYCPDSVIGIVPIEGKSTSEFIEFTLRFYKQVFRDMAPETARANINLETLRPLEIPVPPLKLQERFGQVYRHCYSSLATTSQYGEEAENLFAALTGRAFRGEL